MHWHPAGRSHATFPHLHLYTVRRDDQFVTPRQTLESAVQWCIEMGAEPPNPDWRTVLASPRASTVYTGPGPRSRRHRPPALDVHGRGYRHRLDAPSPSRAARAVPLCRLSHNPPNSGCAGRGRGGP
ncbi:protein of unknown function [Blastococcus saxobsidens DD2]|uniref:Uncharacterized protein n=1 Tax=Blastococcus saxobsidens (strain DD2) TaxID=1146883 RepID=H6RRM5_BLASD|nr:protein of unknown function [Blastococcus saxobsidens DD2]